MWMKQLCAFQWCESAGVNMFGDDDDPSRNDDRSKGGAS